MVRSPDRANERWVLWGEWGKFTDRGNPGGYSLLAIKEPIATGQWHEERSSECGVKCEALDKATWGLPANALFLPVIPPPKT